MMKRIIALVSIFFMLFCTSCSEQQSQMESDSKNAGESSITQATEISDLEKTYKLPSKIISVDPESEVQVCEHNFLFAFSEDEPYVEDVWYLTLDENNLIVKALCKKDDQIDEVDFEYNSDDLISKVTYKYNDEISSVDEFTYSNDNTEITATVTEMGSKENVAIITIDENNWVLAKKDLNNSNNYCLSKSYEYDDYGNIINDSNSVNEFPLENIQYDENNNIISADRYICDVETGAKKYDEPTVLKFAYDEVGYPTKIFADDTMFEISYSDYSETEYNALKKLSVVWIPAGFRYYNAPSIDLNYYKK